MLLWATMAARKSDGAVSMDRRVSIPDPLGRRSVGLLFGIFFGGWLRVKLWLVMEFVAGGVGG